MSRGTWPGRTRGTWVEEHGQAGPGNMGSQAGLGNMGRGTWPGRTRGTWPD